MQQLPVRTALGAHIRHKRGATTLVDLARSLGVTHATLSRTETGATRPSANLTIRLARWLEVEASQILTWADTTSTPTE